MRELTGRLGGAQVGTVGRFELQPNLVNVVPSTATIVVDLRNTDNAALAEAERLLDAFVDEVAAQEGVRAERRSLARFDPVDFDPSMIDLVEATAQRLGHTTRRMPSGAGHDAQMLARLCPTSMIFTPSVAGLSHNIAEFTESADLAAGANVLLHVVADLLGIVKATTS